MAIGVSLMGGLTAYTYDNSGETPCVWDYDANTTLNMPYRSDPLTPPSGAYLSAYSDAMSSWENADTPAQFYQDNSQNSHLIAVTAAGTTGPLGNTAWFCSLFYIYGDRVETYVYLNSTRLVAQHQTYKTSVAAHEMGHFIGVRHSTVSPALMNTARNRTSIYEPQEDDECAVNDRYSHTSYPVTC